jgi:hypothetical protein
MQNVLIVSSNYFLNIFSTDVKPKHPNANKATDSTRIGDGAVCSLLKLL